MIDLTSRFQQAAQRATTWTKTSFVEILDLVISLLPNFRVVWDEGAGETWAYLFDGSRVVGIVRYDAPLAIFLTDYTDVLQQELQETGIVVILVTSMEKSEYRLDPSIAKSKLFPRWLWRSETVNPECFSIMDLWWVTI